MAADVLGSRADASVADLLVLAEGNPLYITELLRGAGPAAPPAGRDLGGPGPAAPPAGLDRGGPGPAPALPVQALPAPALPAPLRSAVTAPLRSLPEPVRDLLKVASVLSREFTASELAAMTGQPVSQLMSPLEQALTAEVITGQAGRLVFRHDLFRQAVYQGIPEPIRRGLHRDAATALLAQGAPVVRVAIHLALGAEPGDEEAISVLTQAIGELVPTSATAAADLGLRVLELAGPGDPRRPGFVANTVGLLGWASRVDEARALGEGYLGDYPQPAALEAEIQRGMRRAWVRTTHEPYPAPLPAHLMTDATVPAGIRAELITFEQVGAMWQDEAEDVERALRQAAALAADTGNRASLGMLRNAQVALAHEHGRLLEALETAQAGPDPTRRRAPPPAPGAGLHETAIAACLHAVGRTTEALHMLERARQAAYASGDMYVVVRCQGVRALALLELGRLDDSRAEAQAAVQAADDLGLMYFLGRALATLVETLIRQGDVTAADRLASRSPPDAVTGDQCWAAALYADARGRPGAALAALSPVLERLGRNRFTFAALYPSRLPQVAALAMRAGQAEQAGIAARAAQELSRRNPGVGSVAGAAAHTRGLWRSDAGALREAVELFAKEERPMATAAAREDLASALVGQGDKDEAIGLLEAAYDAYLAANAARDLARVRGALHALGVRKRQPSVARPEHGWASLTAGERAVVQVVAEGLTSREAAAQLYLSPDTVNTHLRHAFTKLGIRSRVELARLVLSRPSGQELT
jgi:DNA-binding CsgD family transcriptional regulator